MNSDLSQWSWVYNSHETDYAKASFVQEFWCFKAATFFIYPAMIKTAIWGRSSNYTNFKPIYLAIDFLGIALALFHVYVSYFTQFLSLSLILITQLNYARKANLEIPHAFECFIATNYVLGLYYPILICVAILALFVVLAKHTISLALGYSIKGRLLGLLLVILNIGTLICVPLDFLSDGFEYYIAISHILMATHCYIGLYTLEYLHSKGFIKDD